MRVSKSRLPAKESSRLAPAALLHPDDKKAE